MKLISKCGQYSLDHSAQILRVTNLATGDCESAHSSQHPTTTTTTTTTSPSSERWWKKVWRKLSSRLAEANKSDTNDLDIAREINISEHLLALNELEHKLKTSLKEGLSSAEAERRYIFDGPNAFSEPKQDSIWYLLFREFFSGFALIIWLAALASLICYFIEYVDQDYYLTVVLAFVVIVTGIYSFTQERKSGKLFESFKHMIPQETTVIRDGRSMKLSADRLVVGDVVECRSGERIPADVRMIRTVSMKVDNSSLTGESEPLQRGTEAGHRSPLEAKNLAFFSTSCVDGHGTGVVIATGDRTVMGKIAKLVTNIETQESPMNVEIRRFVLIIAAIAILEGFLFFIICLLMGMSIIKAIGFTIGIIVGNIPEGLLPALTLALTLTARRMVKNNCLIKRLESVETLGSTSTICSDKTGTLTQNQMTVEHCYLGRRIVRATHEPDSVVGGGGMKMDGIDHYAWRMFQRCAKLCSRAAFVAEGGDDGGDEESTSVTSVVDRRHPCKRKCTGDASESAILRWMESVSPSVEVFRRQHPKVAEKPFSSTYKYQFSIHAEARDGTRTSSTSSSAFFLVMKGAPDRIVQMCTSILIETGETVPLTAKHMNDFEEVYRELGSLGERVLALCDLDLPQFSAGHKFDLETDEIALNNLRFLGLVAMIDPPRASVPDAVAKCKSAGVKVVMVTGDHPITAQAIAKSVGIFTHSHRRSTQISLPKIDLQRRSRYYASVVIPGDELANLSDAELRSIVNDTNEIVFARTSPQQKLRIVEACQEMGQIVAVTGDGVNDSPALKKADIGIAMGITGSDVSKQAADMILMDDNFASIVTGIEEGRKIFDNIKKTISYILAGNSSTLYPFIIYIIFGFPLAITPIMILCIALGTDMVPAISLAYEKAESDIMKLRPRDPKKDHLVTLSLILWSFFQGGIIITASGYLGYFVTFMDNGWMPWQLWQIRAAWESEHSLLDFYGHEWTLESRNRLLSEAQTSYFVAVVVVQWMDVIVNKTRRMSIFKQGMSNWFLNASIVLETGVTCFLVYTPSLNEALTFVPIGRLAWLAGVPFFFYLLAYEELRKFWVRSYPNSFLGQELAR